MVSPVAGLSSAEDRPFLSPASSSAVVENSYPPWNEAESENGQSSPAGGRAYGPKAALPPVRYHRVMLPTPVPFPSEAVYQTQNVRTFSYVGKAPAADVVASLSIITNDSVWLFRLSTER